jgi:hypothetical protein
MVECRISSIGINISFNKTSISFYLSAEYLDKSTHFHLSTHRFKHTPKDLDTELKDLVHRTDGVPRKTKAEVLLGSLQERSHFHRGIGRDTDKRIDEQVGMRLEDSEDEME